MARPKLPAVTRPVELSVDARARLGVAAELAGRREGALGALAPRPAGLSIERKRRLPDSWSVVHVLDRLEEAYEVLGRTPMTTRPRGYVSPMPKYAYEHSDLVAQVETGELDRLMRSANRVRLGATSAEIERMEQALRWCAIYLADKREVAEAVGLYAKWAAQNANISHRCRELGISKRTLYRRNMHGVHLIALGLTRDRVPVS
jgi:hypothetical protein